ncbi:hypothetical protein PZB75_31230 (plasmid) [Streptomyces sp. AM 4-1-1]|uniref:hypothetical protein n=1 Tax=Streptomyces sp. AM 4-1-1 TaxID=3028710 RepID=UPI0023B9E089|nr:hypothetical protein [Streptomyces sp. AM 4-1-1]WEH37877.1 hypothetical protein PZB75_31230 [Streptomyces sp. AM 4-1-1]
MRALAVRAPAADAANPGLVPPAAHVVRAGAEVSVDDLFPDSTTARAPFEVAVGDRFDTLTMPRRTALDLIARFGERRAHPVGAAVARPLTDKWVLILPPGSGDGMQWSGLVDHRDEGVLTVPPRAAGPANDLSWARLGNRECRVFSAPILLHFALFPQHTAGLANCGSVRTDLTSVGI